MKYNLLNWNQTQRSELHSTHWGHTSDLSMGRFEKIFQSFPSRGNRARFKISTVTSQQVVAARFHPVLEFLNRFQLSTLHKVRSEEIRDWLEQSWSCYVSAWLLHTDHTWSGRGGGGVSLGQNTTNSSHFGLQTKLHFTDHFFLWTKRLNTWRWRRNKTGNDYKSLFSCRKSLSMFADGWCWFAVIVTTRFRWNSVLSDVTKLTVIIWYYNRFHQICWKSPLPTRDWLTFQLAVSTREMKKVLTPLIRPCP